MNLYQVNSVLSEAVDVLGEMKVGETIDNGVIRAHLYRGSVQVTDLTNAGKRGKKVDRFSLYDMDLARSPQIEKLIDQFLSKLPKAKSYKMALSMAKGIEAEAERRRESYPKVETSVQRGVDVAGGGFKKIEVNGPNVYVRADNSNFSVRDKRDQHNDPTCIAPSRAKKTAVAKFYKWAKANEGKIKSMTFEDVMDAMDKNGIDFHHYCAVD